MPRQSIDEAVEEVLDVTEGGSGSLELRVDFVDELTGRSFFTGGGVWDTDEKCYVGVPGDAKTATLLSFHQGQLESARWFAAWLNRYKRREVPMRDPDGRAIWSVCLMGGRRGGKSDLGFKLAIAHAITVPRSITWIVIPGFPDRPEVERELEAFLPRGWYKYRARPDFFYRFANGSELWLKSQDDPEDVKRGRCDLAIMNEAQKQQEQTFSTLLPSNIDRGGLTVLLANPPKRAGGQWIADYVGHARAGFRLEDGIRLEHNGKVFQLDPQKNPHVNQAALLATRGVLSKREYRIEILGEILPPPDVVMYGYSSYNCIHTPQVGDITAAFTERWLGVAFTHVVGIDAQRAPHMAATVGRVFVDPDNPGGWRADPNHSLYWFERELVIENGNEDDVCDGLEGLGLDPHRTALVVDASMEWQDVDRTKGKASCDVLRRRGWRQIYLPDAKAKRNPLIEERISVANTRFQTADEKRHCFIDPRCTRIDEALRKWEMRNGIPHRRSIYAHVGDGVSYPLFRLYPRREISFNVEMPRLIDRPGPSANWEDIRDGRPTFDL